MKSKHAFLIQLEEQRRENKNFDFLVGLKEAKVQRRPLIDKIEELRYQQDEQERLYEELKAENQVLQTQNCHLENDNKELEDENQKLKDENQKLKDENQDLRKRCQGQVEFKSPESKNKESEDQHEEPELILNKSAIDSTSNSLIQKKRHHSETKANRDENDVEKTENIGEGQRQVKKQQLARKERDRISMDYHPWHGIYKDLKDGFPMTPKMKKFLDSQVAASTFFAKLNRDLDRNSKQPFIDKDLSSTDLLATISLCIDELEADQELDCSRCLLLCVGLWDEELNSCGQGANGETILAPWWNQCEHITAQLDKLSPNACDKLLFGTFDGKRLLSLCKAHEIGLGALFLIGERLSDM